MAGFVMPSQAKNGPEKPSTCFVYLVLELCMCIFLPRIHSCEQIVESRDRKHRQELLVGVGAAVEGSLMEHDDRTVVYVSHEALPSCQGGDFE